MATAVATKNECPYCNGDEKPFYDDGGWYTMRVIMPDKAIEFDYEDDGRSAAFWTDKNAINYCPMCGRKL